MSFIVLLLLSLSMHVSIESQLATDTSKGELARQNALLAVTLALDDLMQTAGPDQRVTARGDILDNTAPYWTGVWSVDPIGTTSDAEIKNRTPIKWLVSEPNNGETNILLANAGQTLNSVTEASVVLNDNSANPIILSKQPLEQNGVQTGSYAYWVSDEGTKASVALNPDVSTTRSDNMNVRNPSTMRLDAIDGIVGDQDEYETVTKSLWRTPNLGSASVALSDDDRFTRDHIHDLTHTAYMLPVNVRDGGLKKDLGAAFSDTASWNKLLSFHGSDQIFSPMGDSKTELDPGGPQWHQLRSFYQYRPEVNGEIHSLEPTDEQSGVYPVVSHFSLHHHIIFYEESGGQYRPRLCVFPIFVLWNPYNKPIAPETYFLKVTDNSIVSNKDSLRMQIRPRVFLDGDDGASDTTTYTSGSNALGFKEGAEFPNTMDAPYIFQINSSGIAPGEALIFSAGNSITEMPDDASVPIVLNSGFTDGYYFYKDGVDTMDMSGVITGNANITHFALYMQSANFLRVRLAKDSVSNVENEVLLQHVSGQNSFVPGSGGGSQAPVKWPGSVDQLVPASEKNEPLISGHPAYDQSTFPASGAYMHLKMAANYTEVNNDDDLTTVQRENIPYIKYVANSNPRAPRSSKGVLEEINFGNNNGSDMAFNPTYFGNSEMYHSTRLLPSNHSYYTFNSGDTTVNLGYSDDPSNLIGNGWVLFDIPDDESYFLSVADLAAANITQPLTHSTRFYKRPTINYNVQNLWPAYSIGNSLLDPRIPADRYAQGEWPSQSSNGNGYYHYDVSYLLNDALWDAYFFSAYDSDPLVEASLNSRYATSDAFVYDFDTSAADLLIEGGFNVNSTSVDAWKVFLSSALGLDVDYNNTSYTEHTEIPFLRVDDPANGPTPNDRNTQTEEVYNGFLTLNEDDVEALAHAIVDQVKARGPFTSMAHFVNRVIDDGAYRSINEQEYADGSEEGRQAMQVGALQAAIDLSGVNEMSVDGTDRFNDTDFEMSETELSDFYQHMDVEASLGDLAAGNPGYLTQLDLLDQIGALITVRSDTFKIHVYGEALNPFTGKVVAKSRCTVTVQRMADFIDIDSGNNPETDFDDLSVTNQHFGRGFRIVDFQWADEDTI
ncbi:hypothetical protein [Rubellicoccus peritrichatus]|uniref:Uncharacterized protein n=1 Tax=Rubellicoccus peritrichatus TaxID=3080537 RepID=A0AAQ3LBW1_9BACT|nr:hypothetical protein [Puniceicoccus sp. CR14]WOO41020.1 hypothetical protein RZN69_20565 [Puniceicoccus sp. CR14]